MSETEEKKGVIAARETGKFFLNHEHFEFYFYTV